MKNYIRALLCFTFILCPVLAHAKPIAFTGLKLDTNESQLSELITGNLYEPLDAEEILTHLEALYTSNSGVYQNNDAHSFMGNTCSISGKGTCQPVIPPLPEGLADIILGQR